MKRRLSLLGLAAIITCGGLDNFDVSQSASTSVPGSPLGGVLGAVSFAGFGGFDFSQTADFKNQGVSKNEIDSAKLKTLELTVTSAAPTDLSFLQSVAFYVEAPGQPRKRVASGGPFASGTRSATLAVDDVELKPYVTASSMSLTAETTGAPPAQTTDIDAKAIVNVDVNVSGLICG